MRESTLWEHLKPELKRLGKFQKVSDRFTPGVPDVLGCDHGIPVAMELKEFSGVLIMKVKFRPGQIDWLRDWAESGGQSWVVVSTGQTVYVFRPRYCVGLEGGLSTTTAGAHASIIFKKTRKNSWRDFVDQLTKLWRQE